MPKKTMKKQPPPSPPSFSSSSSDDKSPPPPSISTSKKLSAGSPAALLRKDTKPAVSRYPHDASDSKLEKAFAAAKTLETGVKEEELLESEEEESTEEEASEKREENEQEVSKTSSSSDSGSDRNDKNSVVGPSLKLSGCSKSVDGEEEGGEGSESEEEESTADESSEDLRDKDPKENPPSQLRDSQNKDDDDDKLASKTSSSDSGLGNEKEDIETPISKPSLVPLSNKPIDSLTQSVEKECSYEKQFATSPVQISKKKQIAGIAGAKGGREKDLFKRIWSNGDELVLLNGILEYKERHHYIPYSHVHAELLLKSVKDSLSISVSVNQLNDKVRRMKKRYNNTAARQNLAKKSKFSDPHNAAVFDLSKKIWNSLKGESNFHENKIKLEKKEEDSNKKGELKHFAEEYPSLYWLLKSEHANNALVLQNHISIANAKKLEEKCKELEMIDTKLNMQKIEFLSSAVKLIKDALAKC